MKFHLWRRWLTVGAMSVLPVMAYGQEAALSGTVSDSTGGALPGVVVRAVHEATGNTFEVVTDERGGYRLALRVGSYRLTAELAGFATVSRTVTLLIGQQGVADLQLSLQGVQESVTVSGQAPLLDVTGSAIGSNIDPRQIETVPVNGRDWMQLTLLAPGAMGNGVFRSPNESNPRQTNNSGGYEVNVDGQQISVQSFVDNPQYGRDSIAEFEVLTSRFNATQGRSFGIQLNAVTKSGSNVHSGSFAGYFRDDKFNAADFIAKEVIPYSNQQLSATYGGPIRQDKMHVFGYYEYEHEPSTAVFNTPYPKFSASFGIAHTEKKGGVRVDNQFSPQTRMAVRFNSARKILPGTGANTRSQQSYDFDDLTSDQILVTLTQVLSSSVVNEIKGGRAHFEYFNPPVYLKNAENAINQGLNGPAIRLVGLDVGGITTGWPGGAFQTDYSIRDDFTYLFDKGGRHTFKLGGEYIHREAEDYRCLCDGTLDARGGPVPANIESLFPDALDATTWNLRPLSPISVSWTQEFTSQPDSAASILPRKLFAVWVQDDWAISSRLTLNLGVRYDIQSNAIVNGIKLAPWFDGQRRNDLNDIDPRVGFNFAVNDSTVIRGGWGIYHGTTQLNPSNYRFATSATIQIPYDGRADFASNPFNGPKPTWDQLVARFCTTALVPGCFRRDTPGASPTFEPNMKIPYAYQGSLGVQRQFGSTLAVELDYTYRGLRDYPSSQQINLSYNPATGTNYPYADLTRRPFPDFASVSFAFNGAKQDRHAMELALTKRMSHGWQMSGTYTLGFMYDQDPPIRSGLEIVPFQLVPDLTNDYALASGDQRHRAVLNGLWEMGFGFQFSGLYTYGSGQRFPTNWGQDLRLRNSGSGRLRPDGSVIPRNNFVGLPVHRVDLRFQRRFALWGRASVDGLVDIFNAFNHANYGDYSTNERALTYGQPSQSRHPTAYGPRILQLGFRFKF